MDDRLEAATVSFEGKKLSMNQNKDGVILRILIHPNDVPRSLHTDWVGSRYQVVMVRLGDDDQPEANEQAGEAARAIKSAGLLCRNTAFQEFMASEGYAFLAKEHDAIEGLRQYLGITSRAELKENPEALRKFYGLRDHFEEWRGRNPHAAKTETRHDD